MIAKRLEETVEQGLHGNDTRIAEKSKMTLIGNASPENFSVRQNF